MADIPAGTAVLRQFNTSLVLAAVRQARRPLRISEIISVTRLTRPTVTQAIEELKTGGLVVESTDSPDEVRQGRPAAVFQLRPGVDPVLGIDLGPHAVKARVSDLGGNTLAASARTVSRPNDAVAVLAGVRRVIDACLRDANLDSAQIADVVVGSPGVVDPVAGRLRLAPSMRGWETFNVASHLEKEFRCRVHLENDANLAAVAAASRLPGRTIIAIQWGARLGAGIVINGLLHRGKDSAAGEVGLISLDDGDNLAFDRDGSGPLEAQVGSAGMINLARHKFSGLPTTRLRSDRELTAMDLFNAAAAGDERAVAVLDHTTCILARALSPVILALNPDVLVVSGGIAHAGDVLLQHLRRHLQARTYWVPELELSEYAEHTVVIGSVELARQHTWDRRLAAAKQKLELSEHAERAAAVGGVELTR
ncbi:ROK family protein [Dactylosporangium fulvum]|uniref:ROK family transcriptional regulator n=1 Tax=Dactylosporangium fulvum TaxID=53359 RepID=A0ABY5WBW7_9ACTN|nr:ROK family protein [Dactylosporangium fulvum]UWP85586.1 ROK family transcriptional regulator [Dactylosporangium fulvum]